MADLAGNIGPALAEIARLADLAASFNVDPTMDEVLDPIREKAADKLRRYANMFDGGAGEEETYLRFKAEKDADAQERDLIGQSSP